MCHLLRLSSHLAKPTSQALHHDAALRQVLTRLGPLDSPELNCIRRFKWVAAPSDAKSSPWRALLQQLRQTLEQTLEQTLRRTAVIVAFYIALALRDSGLTTQLL